ncbi:hypothetical protein [Runella sp. SP2]|uniref:hypothetical protein n=1 Tax=Runella sp. SP2 TaxID=2268026 RepID=UPI000F078C36|nr:hypothetical protein [Runella sp. SP2]AYQ32163.1 hypothetical protein DTQ70_08235 [Runella sp. SP2]
MQDVNAAGTKAQFKLAERFDFEGQPYTKGAPITLKEMSSVHTKLENNSIKLSRALEAEN